jgi:hypothetical protein
MRSGSRRCAISPTCSTTISPFREPASASVGIRYSASSGLGDVAGTALALLIVRHAWQTGASKLTLTRMLGNVAADFAIGAIPLIGNLFDFAFKANRRNARLLERHFDVSQRATCES